MSFSKPSLWSPNSETLISCSTRLPVQRSVSESGKAATDFNHRQEMSMRHTMPTCLLLLTLGIAPTELIPAISTDASQASCCNGSLGFCSSASGPLAPSSVLPTSAVLNLKPSYSALNAPTLIYLRCSGGRSHPLG